MMLLFNRIKVTGSFICLNSCATKFPKLLKLSGIGDSELSSKSGVSSSSVSSCSLVGTSSWNRDETDL